MKIRVQSILFVLFLSLGFTACLEEISLDLPNSEPRLVIHGLLTTSADVNWIKLSRTQGYYDTSNGTIVNNATVAIFNESGVLLTNFVFNSEALQYEPEVSEFALDDEQSYMVRITDGDDVYEYNAKVEISGTLDSLYYEYKKRFPFSTDSAYFIKVDGLLPKDKLRYYRWQVTVNDTLKSDRSDYFVFDNEFLQENIVGFELPYELKVDDQVKLEMFSLTLDTYRFYQEFIGLLFSDGGLFSSPPVNPQSNVVNMVNPERPPIGFIQISSYLHRELLIEEL